MKKLLIPALALAALLGAQAASAHDAPIRDDRGDYYSMRHHHDRHYARYYGPYRHHGYYHRHHGYYRHHHRHHYDRDWR